MTSVTTCLVILHADNYGLDVRMCPLGIVSFFGDILLFAAAERLVHLHRTFKYSVVVGILPTLDAVIQAVFWVTRWIALSQAHRTPNPVRDEHGLDGCLKRTWAHDTYTSGWVRSL